MPWDPRVQRSTVRWIRPAWRSRCIVGTYDLSWGNKEC